MNTLPVAAVAQAEAHLRAEVAAAAARQTVPLQEDVKLCGAVLLLIVVSLLAAYVLTRRARRVDPAEMLRSNKRETVRDESLVNAPDWQPWGSGDLMAIPDPAALHHTCFLVRDLEGTAQRLSNALRIGPWNIWTIEPTQCLVHGEESPFSFRVALASVGGGSYELVTPHSGRSVYDEHLERHGEGFHHTCLVYPSLEAVRGVKAELRRQGREIIQEASAGNVFDFAFFSFPEIGSAVEVLYLDASKLPPPEAVIRPSP